MVCNSCAPTTRKFAQCWRWTAKKAKKTLPSTGGLQIKMSPISKHQRFPEWSWRSVRRNWWRTSGGVWKEIFELLSLGKIARRIFHQNSTANFTIKLHYWVVAGPTISGLLNTTHKKALKVFLAIMTKFTIGAKIITLHNFIVSNSFPQLCNHSLHYRIGFELIPGLCNFLRCCKAYHVGIELHYRIVFELIYRLCNLSLHYRIGFELNM